MDPEIRRLRLNMIFTCISLPFPDRMKTYPPLPAPNSPGRRSIVRSSAPIGGPSVGWAQPILTRSALLLTAARLVVAWVLVFLAADASAAPQRIGRWPTDQVVSPNWVAVDGTHAWVASYNGNRIQAVGLTDPALLPVVAEVRMPGTIRGLVATQSRLWVLVFGLGLVTVDTSNPLQPRQVGVFEIQGSPEAVAVDGSRAYVLERRPGVEGTSDPVSLVHILDVSDLANPRRLSTWEVPPLEDGSIAHPTTLAVSEGRLCVGRSWWSEFSPDQSRMEVLDVTDPGQPRWVGFHQARGEVTTIAVSGRRAYWALMDTAAATPRSVVEAVSLDEPATPTRLGTLTVSLYAAQLAVSGNLALVAKGAGSSSNGGMDIIDVSDPTALRRVRTWTIPPQSWTPYLGHPGARGVAIAGTKACVATERAGLHVLEIADPESPVLAGTAKAAPDTRGITVIGDRAHVAAGTEGLILLDVSDAGRPRHLGAVRLTGVSRRVAVSGDHAYVATEVSGLHVVNTADPANPRRVGGLNLNTGFDDVAVVGNHVCVASPGSGLVVIDVSNPASPRRVATQQLATVGNPVAIAVSDGHAFLAQSSSSGGVPAGLVEVFDIRNPAAPTWVASHDTPGSARNIVVRDHKAYVVGTRFDDTLQQNRGYLEILDVSDPAHPVSLGRHHNARAGYGYVGVDLDGGVAWLAEAWADGRVEAVDVMNPAFPTSLGTLPDNALSDVAAAGTRAFLVGITGELAIAEASSTTNPPRLDILRSMNRVTVSWPAAAGDVRLESTDDTAFPADWKTEPTSPALMGDRKVITLEVGPGAMFFRLKKP